MLYQYQYVFYMCINKILYNINIQIVGSMILRSKYRKLDLIPNTHEYLPVVQTSDKLCLIKVVTKVIELSRSFY